MCSSTAEHHHHVLSVRISRMEVEERSSLPAPFLPYPTTIIISHLHRVRTAAFAFAHSWLHSLVSLARKAWNLLVFAYACTASRVHPGFLHLLYITTLSFLGSAVLASLPARDPSPLPYLDLVYTATSAASVGGLNPVDMERFSSAQILVLTILMLLGGEIFVSVLGLLLHPDQDDHESRRQQAKKELIRAILCYLSLFHIAGLLVVFSYLHASSGPRGILREKGLGSAAFAVCAVVSSFANVGILPNDENMSAFVKTPGLSLLLAPLMLGGGVLYPAFLRSFLWVLEKVKVTRRSKDLEDVLNAEVVKYRYLFPRRRTAFLVVTVLGLFVAQLLLLCCLDWNSPAFDGLSRSEKVAAATFQTVSMRHAGEGAIDFSLVSPAMAVIFIVMMYLPTYTTFLPGDHPDHERKEGSDREGWKCKMSKRDAIVRDSNLSQISYIALSVVLLCMVERRRMSEDPLNYNVFSVLFEVISAYGNVGLSMGYSCGRQLNGGDGSCKDGWYSFSGRWSPEGKLLIIFLMVFGRLKKYHMGGGKAWKLGIPTTTNTPEADDHVQKPNIPPENLDPEIAIKRDFPNV